MFEYTDKDGNIQSIELDINEVFNVRWGNGYVRVPWYDKNGKAGVLSDEKFSGVPNKHKNLRAVRKSAEYEAAAREWLTNNGHNVTDTSLGWLGVGIASKIRKSNNPLNSRHVVHGEIVADLPVEGNEPGEIIIRVHPELPRVPKKTKKELEIENAELRAQLGLSEE